MKSIKIDNLASPECWENAPEQKPALIEGLLRQGDNLLLTAGSKAGKSCLLTELAIALAEGKEFLNVFKCSISKVLYVNFEISRASMLKRFKDAYECLGIEPENRQNIDVLNLKGFEIDVEELKSILEQVLKLDVWVVFLDPVYTLIGDETSQVEVKELVNVVNWLNSQGISCIYSHHHTKGSQSEKKITDRASGSSVLARNTDAILDFVEIENPKTEEEDTDITYWVMDCITREFETPNSEIIQYSYPVHQRATELFEGQEIKEKKKYGLFSYKKPSKPQKTILERFDELFVESDAIPVIELEDKLKISEKSIKLYLGDGVKANEELKKHYRLIKAQKQFLVMKLAG